jgi:hypothetical protein
MLRSILESFEHITQIGDSPKEILQTIKTLIGVRQGWEQNHGKHRTT